MIGWRGEHLFTPEAIRALRGTRSRNAFATLVGVTPQTIYRWELPEARAESRRPRGHQREILLGLQEPEPGGEREPAPATERDPDGAAALPAFERLLRGDVRRAETELVELLAAEKAPTHAAMALASVGLALAEATQRGSARAALLALAPALRAESAVARLPRRIALFVNATAAIIYSLPDGQLFDLGRVQARVARIDELAVSGDDSDVHFLGAFAITQAAMYAGERDLVERASTRGESFTRETLSPLFAIHWEEMRMFGALVTGQVAQALGRAELLVQHARDAGSPLVEARALAWVAMRLLDDLADPEVIIATARRALDVSARARLAPNASMVFAARALIEANVRLGRFDEAHAATALVEEYANETGMPPTVAAPSVARLHFIRGDIEPLRTLAARFDATENVTMKPLARACARHVEALALFATSEDANVVVAAFQRACEACSGWPFMHREAIIFLTGALSTAGRIDEARASMRRATRVLDFAPSPWSSAHLLRIEGLIEGVAGDWSHGRRLVETSIATFELARDLPDVLLSRYILALCDAFHDVPGWEERKKQAEAALANVGLVPPAAARVAQMSMRELARNMRPALPRSGVDLDALVVPLRRLAVRGSMPHLVLRETYGIARELCPGRSVALEELDSHNEVTVLFGSSAHRDAFEWQEFGNGMGRRFRLGVQKPLESAQASALSMITVTAALALEVAGLRGVAGPAQPGDNEEKSGDVPGVIAVSKAMRRVRTDILRLGHSRATVIISGESGVGKEVVARAIHDASPRSTKPYVAFNCAAVPRDLFEGQLFGYKRGSFTGATSDHPGVLRAARDGTVFLDEVGELPLDVQPKLLRFLENGEVFPLGEPRPAQVDVRVVAATHRDLAEWVRQGRFREDLYYRLQVVPLRIPPLRERKEDIVPLARHFLRLLCTAGHIPALSSDAADLLTSHAWPGNVRELRNVLERTLAFTPGAEVLHARNLRLS